ncbi:MAG: VOC family protein [Burkholderiales bacterium]
MALTGFHHVAYRCNNSQETVDFYTKVLGLKYSAAHRVISAHEDHSVTLHTFFQMSDGSHIAFFEVPECKPMIWDPNTPRWVQHIAFEVDTLEEVSTWRDRLVAAGVEIETNREESGIKVGKTITSVYFIDPNGHRLEICVAHKLDAKALEKEAWEMLAQWNADKESNNLRTPQRAEVVS